MAGFDLRSAQTPDPGFSPGRVPPRSLIETTVERLQGLVDSSDTYLVTTAEQLESLRALLPGIPEENFIAEPRGCNTAMCVALALAFLSAATKTLLPP